MRLIFLIFLAASFLSANIHPPLRKLRSRNPSPLMKDSYKMIALRVQFEKDSDDKTEGDGTFNMSRSEPENVPHDKAYFERYLFHTATFIKSASYGKHVLDYEVSEKIYTLKHQMSYYGDNTDQAKGLAYLVRDAISEADSDIDFSEYDGVIIFHAGIGEETDGNFSVPRDSPSDIASSIVYIELLREYLGNRSSSYKGIKVDGIYINRAIVAPENETQDYDKSRDYDAPFGMVGILSYLYLRFIGVPDLITYETTEGGSPTWAGTGLWDIMGLGLWCGSKDKKTFSPYQGYGFVPASPCAWVRKYMGWAEIDTLNAKAFVSLFRSSIPGNVGQAGKLVLIPIKNREYFLIENRIQDINNNGRFDWDDTNNDGSFDFMTDTFENAEWDFFTPGYGRGSGLIVWHINEDGIEEAIREGSVNKDRNFPNVYLVPADGNETSFYLDNPNDFTDLFNKTNNPSLPATGWPSSIAFDGGYTHIWLRSISEAKDTMTFSFLYDWTKRGWPLNEASKSYLPGVVLKSGNENIVFQGDTEHNIHAYDKYAQPYISSPWRKDIGIQQSPLFIMNYRGGSAVACITKRDADLLAEWAYPERPERVYSFKYGDVEYGGIVSLTDQIILSGTEKNGALLVSYSQDNEKEVFRKFHAGFSGGAICKSYFNNKWGIFWCTYANNEAVIRFVSSNVQEQVIGRYKDTRLPVSVYSAKSSENDMCIISASSKIIIIDSNKQLYETQEFKDFKGVAIPADINRDGRIEIIRSGYGRIYVFNYNGTIYEEYPFDSSKYPNKTGYSLSPMVYCAQEIDKPYMFFPFMGLNCFSLDSSRKSLFGFPVELPEGCDYPYLVDIDEDNYMDMFCPGEKTWTFYSFPYKADTERIFWQGFSHDFMLTGRYTKEYEEQNAGNNGIMDYKKTYLYPNPARDYTIIRVQVSRNSDIDLQMFNVAGKKVGNGSIKGVQGLPAEFVWKVDKIPTGIYIIRVKVVSQGIEETKLMKLAIQRR